MLWRAACRRHGSGNARFGGAQSQTATTAKCILESSPVKTRKTPVAAIQPIAYLADPVNSTTALRCCVRGSVLPLCVADCHPPQAVVVGQGDRAFGGKARGSCSWCTSKIGPTPGGPDFRFRARFLPKTAAPYPAAAAGPRGAIYQQQMTTGKLKSAIGNKLSCGFSSPEPSSNTRPQTVLLAPARRRLQRLWFRPVWPCRNRRLSPTPRAACRR